MSMPGEMLLRRCTLLGLLSLPLTGSSLEPPANAVGLHPRTAGEHGADSAVAHSVLRCFQAGRLVFESAGQAPLEGDGKGHIFNPGARDAPSVQVLDLHQGLCVLQSPGAAR